ncbi:hypothetical protein PILCRDRAFT_233714 [Piloderma croceum F 1598]|jgi:hypothetical protein|uniref:Uncharacterized protein n=1 Tax=Piloderma croceum (strain F 1598) TaxID=765440 RepID=A0A0C3GDD2_PILCF|nr:hypothetical protein PILCRDRAFT_233714 [Piloderma croceum F 1598]
MMDGISSRAQLYTFIHGRQVHLVDGFDAIQVGRRVRKQWAEENNAEIENRWEFVLAQFDAPAPLSNSEIESIYERVR